MNFELKGKIYNYYVEDDKISIFKKKDLIFTGNIADINILCFLEKNIFGAGQIVLSLPDREKVFIDGFRNEHRNSFIELFQLLKAKTAFLNLSYFEATQYVKPDIKKKENFKGLLKRSRKKRKLNC
jgi:hypothetical protein